VRLALEGQLLAKKGRLLSQRCAQLLILLLSLLPAQLLLAETRWSHQASRWNQLLVLLLPLLLAETGWPHQASPSTYQGGQQV